MTEPLNRLQKLQNLRIANVDVALAVAFISLVTGNFLFEYVQYNEGSDYWVNVMISVPAFMGLLQIVGGIVGRGYPSFKPFILVCGTIWRAALIAFIFIPLLPVSADVKFLLLAIFLGIGFAAKNFSDPIYNDWIAETVPPNSRGWYFSQRGVIATLTGVAAGIIGAVFVDRLREAYSNDIAFSALFTLGIVCASGSLFFFLKMRDFPRENPLKRTVGEGLVALWQPVKNAQFRKVLRFVLVFLTGQFLAGGLFFTYGREVLRLPLPNLQFALALGAAAGTLLLVRFVGMLADKYGSKPILAFMNAGIVFTPVMWIICRPGEDTFNTIVLFVGHIFAGGFWGGVGVCMLNLYIATSERDDRPSYIGMAFAVQSLVAGAIPLVGAAVLEMLRGYFQYGTDYRVFFVIVMALRLLALLSLLPVEEEGSRSIRDTIKQLRGISPRGMRSLSQLREGSDSRVRASAIEKIGQTQFTFATDELVKALGDPSPAVRRKASQALGSMRDPRAAEAVIRFVEQNPALADEEGLRAIGELGGPGALELLLRYLRDPRSLLRRGAARALGRLGDAGAVPALVKVAREVGEPDMRQAAIESLRLLGADGGQDALHDALFDPHPTVRIAAAEAVADLKISSARPYLRRALEYFPDEAASELAYALSVVGERQDLPEVIRAAEHAPSQISRRRSLLGAAALLGIENECHRLMMMDGIARDNALMRLLRTSYRQDRTLRAAVDTYGAGNEPEALRMLSEASHDEALSLFAQHPAEEAFLVAVVFYGNLRRPRSRKE